MKKVVFLAATLLSMPIAAEEVKQQYVEIKSTNGAKVIVDAEGNPTSIKTPVKGFELDKGGLSVQDRERYCSMYRTSRSRDRGFFVWFTSTTRTSVESRCD